MKINSRRQSDVHLLKWKTTASKLKKTKAMIGLALLYAYFVNFAPR